MQTKFAGIWRACFAITLDNGGLHRDRPEEQVKAEFDAWLSKVTGADLPAIDAWLAALSADDFETVTAGEESDAARVLQSAPPYASQLLYDYFEKVC